MHEDIGTSRHRLVWRDRNRQLGIQNGKATVAKGGRKPALQPSILVGDNAGIAHFTSGSGHGGDAADRQGGANRLLFRIILPDIAFIGTAIGNGLGRIDHAASANGQKKIYIFLLCQGNSFPHF